MITSWSWWWEVDNQQNKLARTILTISAPMLIILLWYKHMFAYTRTSRALLPPGPYGLPVVGYLPFLSSNLHERFTEIAHRYGPIFSLRLGSKLHIVVNSVDLAKVVIRDLDQTFANRSPTLTALAISYGGYNIVWSNKMYWRNLRKLLVSQFLSSTNLNECQRFRKYEVRKMVTEVYSKIGTKIGIKKTVFNTQVNVVTSMLWGLTKSGEEKDLSYTENGFRDIVFKIIELLGEPNISDFIPLLSGLDVQGKQRQMQKQRENLDNIFDSIIKRRIEAISKETEGSVEEDRRKDFLSMLLDPNEHQDATMPLNIDQIKALLIDIVVGGTDTTSTMVEWVMAEILRNPSAVRKVQAELTTVVGMNIVEESHLPQLTYLDAVIKETFRLHPPLPLLIQRCPDETCMVAGYTIPKGSIVYINVWTIHHDPQNWTSPLEFKPERFLRSKWDYNGNNLMFLPFGSGRRICPGIPLGEKMLIYILASLLHSFEWSLPKDEEFELSDKFGFVMKKRKPLVAIPTQRLSDASNN
ncbi:putative cytochrome P450 [Tanacetum coccineum]